MHVTTKTFPEGPEVAMDQVCLKELIHDAIKAGVRDLAGTDVSGQEWLVFRAQERGWGSTYIPELL